MAGAGGAHTPDVGFKVDPAAAFGLPLVAELVGAAADVGIDALHGSDVVTLALHIVLTAQAQQQVVDEGVHLAKADFGVHVVQVDLLAVRQIPVVFYKQAAAGNVAVGHLFAGAVEVGHIGNQGVGAVGAWVFAVVDSIVQVARCAAFAAEICAFAAVAVGNEAV